MTSFVSIPDEGLGVAEAVKRNADVQTEAPRGKSIPLEVGFSARARDPMPVPAHVDRGSWIPSTGNFPALESFTGGIGRGPRLVFPQSPHDAYRIRLALSLRGMEVLRFGVRSTTDGEIPRERSVWLDVAHPGALHHELERVALYTNPTLAFFELELEGALAPGEELREITLVPADADMRDVPAEPGMAIELLRVEAEQVPTVSHVTRFVPERFADRPMASKRQDGTRDAVVFAWFVPAQMPELGEYYLGLLRYFHPDAKLFIGMNHGSDPIWEERFRASGLDVKVRWARPEIDDYWDTTGFLTALEGFHHSDESFDLVWFGHTKGGSRDFADYTQIRFAQMRTFWARRAHVENVFADPQVGFWASRYNLTPPYPFPGPWKGWTDDLAALQRVYRDDHAPLGLNALDTTYVLRGSVLRRFCDALDTDFFHIDPGAYGANKWFFEMAFPSIASMQGFVPFIDMDVPGANDPRDDLMLSWDVKQTHRLAAAELARWGANPTVFEPRIIPWDRPAWAKAQAIDEASSREAQQRTPLWDTASDPRDSDLQTMEEVLRWRVDPVAFRPRQVPSANRPELSRPTQQDLQTSRRKISPAVTRQSYDIPRAANRDAVIFAWFVPERMPEFGEYYLNLLRYHHFDAKIFIGMNRRSDPAWEKHVRESGLDVEIRWARPEIEDYWDTTGFLTALEAFAEDVERFELVWFGHTKGASQSNFGEYEKTRFALERTFWTRRSRVRWIFTDSRIGIFAPRFSPLPTGYFGDELPALLRVYRGPYAPIGLHAKETFFVMRGEIVREFCSSVDVDFFRAPPGSYGAGRYFFEIGFPNVATMQGYEPFIDPDVSGANHPRDDVWLSYDPKQNHRLARTELERWRVDPIGFEPRAIRELWDPAQP